MIDKKSKFSSSCLGNKPKKKQIPGFDLFWLQCEIFNISERKN